MKVFISHQRADSLLAEGIAKRLKGVHQIDYYLDVFDAEAGGTGPALGEHIRAQLGTCDQLLAVVSENSKASWWVPWEIGIATEKEQPIASYAADRTVLPTYLLKWPYLRSNNDLDSYAAASKQASVISRSATINEQVARRSRTAEFYRDLKARLGR